MLTSFKDTSKSVANGANNLKNSIKDYGKWNVVPRMQDAKESMKNRMAARGTPEAKALRAERMQKAGQGMMMASMIPMMASGFVEDPKQQQGLMALGGAMAIIPMLQQFGPLLGSITLAVGALGAAFVMTKKDLDNTAKSAAEFGSNLGGAANRMETMSGATGYGFASTRSSIQDFRFTEQQSQGAAEIMPYFDSEEGKKLVEYLNSKLVVYLIKATKWSNFETCKQLFWYIPLPTYIHNVNNTNVNNYFDLTEEEIITINK
jgi:hypothetical protein